MATDGPSPTPCDPEIFRHGEPIAILTGASNAVERWVQAVAKEADARVDWHYSGGRAQVLHLGDADSRARVMLAMGALLPTLEGRVLHLCAPGDGGLFRSWMAEEDDDGGARG